MRIFLSAVAMLSLVACASENPSTKRMRYSLATPDCERIEQICLESYPPQCFDVCLDDVGGGSTDCVTATGVGGPDGDGSDDLVICGGDECVVAPIGDSEPGGGDIACTADAKLCPDGVTYVGRTGPNCAFAACPGEIPPDDGIACTQEAKLCPDGETYVGRTGPYCEFAACPGEVEPQHHELPPGTEVIICPSSGSSGSGGGSDPGCTVSVDSSGRESFECPPSPPPVPAP